MAKKKTKAPSATIAQNKKARHDYHLEERFEAGLVLHGWEVKSLREGRVQLKESYIQVRRGEAFWSAHVSPLVSASTTSRQTHCARAKLLLNKTELNRHWRSNDVVTR